jgi:glycosyltransferase involved in cell wall biosynthesis
LRRTDGGKDPFVERVSASPAGTCGLNAVVLTSGDPAARTGGSLFHRRIAERAPRLGVRVAVRSIDGGGRIAPLVEGADVIVVDSIVAARIDPAALRRPVVASVHQRPGGLVGPVAERLANAVRDVRSYRRADAIVVPSAYLARSLGRVGVRASRIRVVEPGTDPRRVGSRRARTDVVSFVCVANLAPHKRPLDLLDAFAVLADLDVSLTLVGGGPDAAVASDVTRRLERPDLAGRARWLGSLPPERVRETIRESDILVLPATGESYGMAVAEALREGVPAIVAGSGNLPELVLDGADGYVVPPRDVGALAAAMRRMAVDPARRTAMGVAAAARASRFPTWERTAERFVAVLASVVQPAGVGSPPAGKAAA